MTTAPSTSASTAAPASTSSAPNSAAAAAASVTAPATPSSAPAATPFVDDGKWTEGKDYERIEPAQPKVTSTDKVEVVEVFSYGCPACNQFHATVNKLARELPANVQMVYLPAAFNPPENWPMLQRAYYAAQALGVADQGNDAMYDAVWKTRELSAMNETGQGLKPAAALPTIEDAAKVYAKFGADPKEFVAVANSFSVNTKMHRADELVKSYGIEGTPTIVVDGKYRFSPNKVGYEQSVELTKWLAAREAAGK
jgi:thiol:disulfide interchange protein DsbA